MLEFNVSGVKLGLLGINGGGFNGLLFPASPGRDNKLLVLIVLGFTYRIPPWPHHGGNLFA